MSLVDESSIEHWQFIEFGGREAFTIEGGELSVEAGYPFAGFVWQGDPLPGHNYELELEAFLGVIAGERPPERPASHDLLVQETLLRATE